MSTNTDMYKTVLAEDDFYQTTAQSLRASSNGDNANNQDIPRALVFFSIVQDTVTADWLQNLAEENIEATTNWLNGEADQWVLYVPVSDINSALVAQIDDISSSLAKNQSLAVCDTTTTQSIRQNGYSSITDITCIPGPIANSQETASEFFELENSPNPLGEIIPNTPFNTRNDRFVIDTVLDFAQQGSTLRSGLDLFRSIVINIQNFTIPIFIILILAGMLLSTFGRIAGYNALQQTQSTAMALAVSTGLMSIAVYATLAISVFTTSQGITAFLPGVPQTQIVTQLGWKGVHIVFQLLLPAFGFAVFLLIISLLAQLFRFFANQSHQAKNQEILQYKSRPELSNTFDGQFHQHVQENQAKIATESLMQDNQFEQFYNPNTLSTQPIDNHAGFTGTPDQIETFYQQEEEFFASENLTAPLYSEQEDKADKYSQMPGL